MVVMQRFVTRHLRHPRHRRKHELICHVAKETHMKAVAVATQPITLQAEGLGVGALGGGIVHGGRPAALVVVGADVKLVLGVKVAQAGVTF